MGSALSLRRSEFSVVWLPTKPWVDATLPPLDDPQDVSASRGKAAPATQERQTVGRFLMAFCIGIVATLTWQSGSDAARQLVANSSSQLGALTPVAQTTPEAVAPAAFVMSPRDRQDLVALRQSIDQLAAGQQQLNSGFVQLASVQQQMTRDITRLQQTERHIASKTSVSVPLPRPAPPEARKHPSRPTTITASPNTHHTLSSSAGPGSPPSPVLLTRLDTGHKRARSSAVDPRTASPEPFSQSLISARQSLISALSKITGIQL